MSTKKKILLTAGVILTGIIIFLAWPSNYYLRQTLIHLYPSIDDASIFSSHIIKAGNPHPWLASENYNQAKINEKYLPVFKELETVAFLVIKDEKILFEQYWNGYNEYSETNSFSMAKSMVGLLVGCAIDDGLIRSVDQPVKDFVPGFDNEKFKTLTIKHLLTMSAGVDFEESYSSPFSTTTRFYYGNNLKKMTLDMKQLEEPGVYVNYQSGVTQLLSLIVEKATGKALSDYASEKIWTPIQAEHDALWSLDKKDGIEKAYCCYYSNARDFARLGQLILNKGCWGDHRVISEEYLHASITPDTSLIYKKLGIPNQVYGYQWWNIPRKPQNIYYARGLYGQYILAIPDLHAVIVRLGHKQSDGRDEFDTPSDVTTWLEAGMEILQSAQNKS